MSNALIPSAEGLDRLLALKDIKLLATAVDGMVHGRRGERSAIQALAGYIPQE